jgi:hypothetical protein
MFSKNGYPHLLRPGKFLLSEAKQSKAALHGVIAESALALIRDLA